MTKQPDIKCPRCDSQIVEFPALSRRDNTTEICSRCGKEEAEFDMWMTTSASPSVKREFAFLTKLIRDKA